jgi:hypothetical protein
MHAARGERDVLVVLIGRLRVDRCVTLAHVGDRAARVADPLHDRDHLGAVLALGEVVRAADRLPGERQAAEQGSDREAEHGQPERRGGDAAGGLTHAGHEASARDGLTLEGTGHLPVDGVLGLRAF